MDFINYSKIPDVDKTMSDEDMRKACRLASKRQELQALHRRLARYERH